MTFNRFNIALRIATIGSRFLLLIYLGRYLSFEALGIYGLVAATQVIGAYLVGFGFHTYATRELLRLSPEERPVLVWSQLRFHFLMYLVGLPLLLGFFGAGLLPWWTAPWTLAIVVATHITLEQQRWLIALSEPTKAYLVLFLSHGSWVLPVVAAGWFQPSLRRLDIVLVAWAVASILTAIGAALVLARRGLFDGGPARGSLARAFEGVKTCWILFLSILIHRVIELADRYFIELYRGTEDVGVYTLLSRVAGNLNDFVNVGVVAVALPHLVQTHQRQETGAFKDHARSLARSSLIVGFGLVPFATVGMYVLALLVDRPLPANVWPVFGILCANSLVLVATNYAHYSLYAWGEDRTILYAGIAALGLNLPLNYLLVPRHGVLGAAAATTIAFGAMAVLKTAARRRLRLRHGYA